MALAIEQVSREQGSFTRAIRHPDLGRHYATVNLVKQLQLELQDIPVVTVSSCQNCDWQHFLVSGEAIGEAVRRSNLRVLMLASGALSHKFNKIDWKPKNPRIFHESNVSCQENIDSDKHAIDLMKQGRHDLILERWDEDYRRKPWEAFGAHYLQMIGAMGGASCTAKGEALSDYENARGTGNIHVWFDTQPYLSRNRSDESSEFFFDQCCLTTLHAKCIKKIYRMNFEFPFETLPLVMQGPRVERRRVLVGGSAFWGTIVEEGEHTGLLRLDDGRVLDPQTLAHLPPVAPSKIIAIHISYSSRSIETRNRPKPTDSPTYFTKPPTSLNGHRGEILKPVDCEFLNYEGEYAVVISRTCRNVLPHEAWDYIEGFCPALDMGLQNFRDTDQGSMLRVKGADTLLPIGPGIVRGVNLFEQTLTTRVNGQVVQQAHIGEETIWGPHYAIADIARHITLEAGDVILMGTPCHSRSVSAGQWVECEITALGCIGGMVTAAPAPRASALGVGHPPTDSPEVRRVALGFDERVPERFKQGLRDAQTKGVSS